MDDESARRKSWARLALYAGVWAIAYLLLSQQTERGDFEQLALLYGGSFLVYAVFLKFSLTDFNWKQVVVAAIVLRVVLLSGTPNLSDDYVRFYWDGQLVAHDISPYAYTPEQLLKNGMMDSIGLDSNVFTLLNSPAYYSVYPPADQAVYNLGVGLGGGSLSGFVLATKWILLLFEIGLIFIMIRLLRWFELPNSSVAIYALNPLVIIEIMGNLHFEGVMLFFLAMAVALLVLGGRYVSSFVFSIAVSVKLLPLMFLPLLIRRIGWKHSVLFGGTVLLLSITFFLPFFDAETFLNLGNSIDLYFQNFEFNASVYYLVRWIGFQSVGYNIISWAGPGLAIVTTLLILVLCWKEKNPNWQSMINLMLFSMSTYFFLSTTVHPWYIISLVMLSTFTRYRFAILWSGLVWLTYVFYSDLGDAVYYALVAAEYIAVFTYLLLEWRNPPKNIVAT